MAYQAKITRYFRGAYFVHTAVHERISHRSGPDAQRLEKPGIHSRKFYSISQYIVLSRLLGNLLFRALRRSERIYMGMLSRNYSGIPMQQELGPIRITDWLAAAVWLIPVLVLFILDIHG